MTTLLYERQDGEVIAAEKPEIIAKIEQLYAEHGETVQIPSAPSKAPWWRKLFGAINPVRPGYLWIEEKDDHWNVQWATGRTTHNGYVPTISVDFDKATGERWKRYGLSGAWQSALSMWPVRKEEEANIIYHRMVSHINRCVE